MQELPAAIPDAEVLLALEPEELAAKILFLLRQRRSGSFNTDNLTNELSTTMHQTGAYAQARQEDVLLVFSEAIVWLQAQGLIVPQPGLNGQNGWMVLSRRAQRFENESQFADYATARLLQRDMLHRSIAAAAWGFFMRGEYAAAVFQTMRQVEIAVREAAGFAPGEHGVPMIRRAFGKTGPLTDPGAEVAEQDALCALFAGAVGTYKNPHSHRHVLMGSAREAAEIVMMGSHLLRVVDERVAMRAERDAKSAG